MHACVLQSRIQRHLLVELISKQLSLMLIVVVWRIFSVQLFVFWIWNILQDMMFKVIFNKIIGVPSTILMP